MAGRNPQAPAWTREGVKRRLVARLWVRFHMSLILMACGLSAMLASAALLKVGVGSMLARYPIVVVVAYTVFLLCVWLWVKYADRDLQAPSEEGDAPPASRAAKKSRSGDWSLDLPSGGGGGSSGGGGGVFSGKGGGFDGGGASGSWAEGAPRVPLSGQNVNPNAFLSSSKADWAQPPSVDSGGGGGGGGGKSGGFDLGLDIDFEGLVLVVLAVALVAAIAVASGYLVWAAPDILTEAAFGAALAGSLARRSREQDAMGWVAGVMKKTWWPFAVVLALAIAFAGWAHAYYPMARTFREAISLALGS